MIWFYDSGGRFMCGAWKHMQDWQWGKRAGMAATWYDLGPVFVGWRTPEAMREWKGDA